jgi:hypothetical protein
MKSKAVITILPVLVHVVDSITLDGAQILTVATQQLRLEVILLTTAVAQRTHHRVNLIREHIRQLQHINHCVQATFTTIFQTEQTLHLTLILNLTLTLTVSQP